MDNLTHFWDDFIGGLPDVVVALLILALALFVAWLAKKASLKLLKLIGAERGMEKAGIEKKNYESASSFVGNIVYLAVFVLFLPGIFEKLDLNNVATPIVSMMDKFMAYLPNIIGAIIIAMVGLFIAKLVKELLKPLLSKTKLNSVVENVGIDTKKIDIAGIIVNLAYVVVAVFFVVEALHTLQLSVLTNIGNQIIAYLPYAISAAIVMILAYILGSWLESTLVKNFKFSRGGGLIAKIVILVIGVFVTLYQLGIAPAMVNAAFIIVLGSLGIAFAISFGFGARDFASHTMRKLEKKLDETAAKYKK